MLAAGWGTPALLRGLGACRPLPALTRRAPVALPRRSLVQCTLERARPRLPPGNPVTSPPDRAFVTGFQAVFLTAFGAVLAAIARQRAAFHALLQPLQAQLPTWLTPTASVVAIYVREGLMFWVAAGLALAGAWGIWRLVEERERAAAAAAAATAAAAPPPLQGEGEDVKRLRFMLYQARQEASDAKHALQVLHHQSRLEAADAGSSADLARQLEARTAEVRVVRMEAAAAKQELARAQQEAKVISSIVSATLESISLEGGLEEGPEPATAGSSDRPVADQGSVLGGGLVAAASVLQSKVAWLNKRANAAEASLAEARKLENQVREADSTIRLLNEELAALKQDGEQAHSQMQALQQQLRESGERNREMAVAAAKAERHLDAYDRMVIRLEDQVEELQADKKQLQARLKKLAAQQASSGGGMEGGAPWKINGSGHLNGSGHRAQPTPV